MTLILAKECKARMRQCLIEALEKIDVVNGSFLDAVPSSALAPLDKVLPNSLRGQLEKYVGESPVAVFLQGALARDLQVTQAFDMDAKSVPLNQIEGFQDLKMIADAYLDELEALPASYTFTFPLSNALGNAIRPLGDFYELTDKICIAFATEEFKKKFPLRDVATTSSSLLGLLNPGDQWSDSIAYLQVRNEGFVGRFTTTIPELDALASLRSICGLAIAERTWRAPFKGSSAQPFAKFYIHAERKGDWHFLSAENLGRATAEIIERLIPDDLRGVIKSENVSNWVDRNLKDISVVLNRPDRSSNVLLGAQWLFDSYATDDPLLSFISASVVAEILLGDKSTSEKTGVAELLANRCAYLISQTHTQRKKVLKDFKDIYDVRSRIVHQGKRYLSSDEQDKLDMLRWMCIRIIQEESKLIKKD